PYEANTAVETAWSADRDRLQRDRALQAANQHIGAEAAADRRFTGGATVVPSERATAAFGRCVHGTGNCSALRESDVEPDASDAARIGLLPALHGAEVAVHLLLRAENKAYPRCNGAGEHACTHARVGRRGHKRDKRKAYKGHHCFLDHLESPANNGAGPRMGNPSPIPDMPVKTIRRCDGYHSRIGDCAGHQNVTPAFTRNVRPGSG